MKHSFQVLKHGYTSEIKQIVESLILEARKNNRKHAANILEAINKQYDEVNYISVRLKSFKRIFT